MQEIFLVFFLVFFLFVQELYSVQDPYTSEYFSTQSYAILVPHIVTFLFFYLFLNRLHITGTLFIDCYFSVETFLDLL
jgi:hypothetical protein